MFLSKRSAVYYLFFTDSQGKRCKRSTGARSKPEAVEFLRRFNVEEDAKRRTLKPITLQDFSELYLTYSASIHTRKTLEANCTALNEFTRFLSARTLLHTITSADCERFLAKKTSDASPWTARKYFLALSAMFERDRIWERIPSNTWRSVKEPRPPEVLPAYLTREQFHSFLAMTQDRDLREIYILAALTGLRQAELLSMEWEWVDLSRRTVTVTNSASFTTKNKRNRLVPLCDDAWTVLLARRERNSLHRGLVFSRSGNPVSADWVTRKFKKAVKAAGLPKQLHYHSLRHTFGSWLVQGGVSLYQVGKHLGHSSPTVTQIYAHLAPSDMHGVLSPLHLDN